ncbi:hypothetical protein DFQ14_10218 [Halopolyspora algeriensis]|uniref:Uncharacterized protein n=1 Tax=Halopolyspora algeriensis TaxID=1500506 RepID=A0A368VWN6_9ACTN|nr:hypothetical protein [Halopolyspora algeriensis]RCW45717.1 hypothetical protein DFQ14_10218 [Halopolyspora algeriensis]TQM54101.1 hypothetical protein FHU43_2280 [Halopolyspora algeriensis]
MANTAHLLTAGAGQEIRIVVRDDRGTSVADRELFPASELSRADSQLRAAGWNRSAEWIAAKDGWIAPVIPV